MGLPVGEHDLGVTVTAKTATGETITKKIWDSFRVDSRTFQGLVDTIEPVTGITNGVEKTADALHLPSVLKVYGAEVDGEKTTFSADVKWDVENCAYNPKNTAPQSFTVNGQLELREGENNEELDTYVKIKVQVDAYKALNRPVIDSTWTRVITNYAELSLRDTSNEADGYFFVAAESQKELEKGNYIAQVKVAKSELNHYPKLKYIPEGTHYLYCRAYKEESGHTEKYGEWSEGFLLKVNIKTPNAPVVQKLQVKKNDVKIILGSNTEELDGYDVVAARSKDGDEPSDYIKVQCRYSGNSKELILKGVPKGNWNKKKSNGEVYCTKILRRNGLGTGKESISIRRWKLYICQRLCLY